MRRTRPVSRRVIHAALALMALILAALLLAGVLIVRDVRRSFIIELQGQITDSAAVLTANYETGGLEALIGMVGDLTQQPDAAERLVGVFTPEGRRLAGQLDRMPPPADWSEIRLQNEASGEAQPFHIHMVAFPDAVLVVGGSTRLIDNTVTRMTVVLPLVGLIFVIGVVLAGLVVRRTLAGELSRLERVLRRFAGGDVAARIPLDGPPRDTIEDIALLVNTHLAQLRDTIGATERAGAAIAHDLRTPLNRVSLSLQAEAARAGIGPDLANRLEEVTAELQALCTTCDTILRVSSIGASLSRDSFTDFDLAGLAAEIGESYAPVLEDAGFTLRMDLPRHPVPIRADLRMIGQAVVNLLNNVMAHCPRGTTATIRVTQRGKTPSITVSDDGPGVPESERVVIFEPFRRLDPSRGTAGTGLGLALVKAVAHRHGARIVTGDNAPGLSVTLIFPVAGRDDMPPT